MNCLTKSIKPRLAKTAPSDSAGILPSRDLQTELHAWSPLTAGPYLVPVTRWVE